MTDSKSVAAETPHPDLVSICIPAFKARDLGQAIASALAQTYREIEVIVSDDAPDNSVLDVCANFGQSIRYVQNKDREGRGLGNFRNLIRESRGRYVKFLFDDDFLAPNCVQELVKLARTYPAAHLITSTYYYTDQDGNTLWVDNQLGVDENTLVGGDRLIDFIGTNLSNPIGTFSTPLIKREDLFEDSGEPWLIQLDGIRYRVLTDVAMWIRLARRGPVAIHAQPLSYFRFGQDSNSSPQHNPDFVYAVTEWLLVLQNVTRCGVLDREKFIRAVGRLRDHYTYHLPSLPRLEQDLDEALSSLRDEFGIDI